MELTHEQRQQLRRFAPDHLRVIDKINQSARRAKAAGPTAAGPQVDDELLIDFTNLTERLTVGDIEDMEAASGVPTFAMAMFGGSNRSLAGMAALIWVLRRKDDPRYTYKKAREIPAVTLFGLLNQMGAAARGEAHEDEGDDPLEASASPSA